MAIHMRCFLLICLFFFIAHFGYSQPIVYVTESGRGDNSGSSWADALPGTLLASRLPTAPSGTQFWLAVGTYKPTTTTDRTASFSIASGVSVYGGFWGTESTPTERGPNADLTVLSGDIGIVGDRQDNSIHVVSLINTSQTVTINGLTIANGHRRNYDYSSLGAGIYVEPSVNSLHLTLSGCRFVDNVVEGSLAGGGGIAVINKSGGLCFLTIDGCFFVGNGGETGGAVTILNRTGGIYTDMTKCLFTGNQGVFGGAVYAEDNSTFSSQLTIHQCQFIANTALGDGGAVALNCSSYVINSIFQNNQATGYRGSGLGGAVYQSGASTYQQNCLYISNTALYGGAFASSSRSFPSRQSFLNNTFVNNRASQSGGAFYTTHFWPGLPENGIALPNITKLTNCIIWGNTAPASPAYHSEQGSGYSNLPQTNYSILQDPNPTLFQGAGNLFSDPLFFEPANSDYRLSANSPAINAGNPSQDMVALAPTLDLANNPRYRGGRVDIGAYESECDLNACLPFSVQRRK